MGERRQRVLDALALGGPVCLHGAPGVGKTWLAREILDADAVWVSLRGVTASSEVVARVAGAMSCELAADVDLKAALGDRPLVLDAVAGAVFSDLPPWLLEVRVLATSRDHPPAPWRVVSVEPMSTEEAVDLLEALAARRGVPLDAEGDRDVARALVDALGGLPLAIELAVARLRVYPLRQLLERFSLDLLSDRARPARSLRTVLQDSWESLDDRARQTVARASCLAGRFDTEAFEAVADASLDELEALLDASWVQLERGQERHRFAVLGVLRAFAGEHLQGDDREATEGRHAVFHVEEAERAVAELDGEGAPAALAKLRRLEPDLLQIARRGRPEWGPRATLAIARLAEQVGPADAAAELVLGVLEGAEGAASRVDLGLAYAALARGSRHYEAAADQLARVAAHLSEVGPSRRAAWLLATGTNQLDLHAMGQSVRTLEKASSAYEALGDTRGRAATHLRIGVALGFRGDPDGARRELSLAEVFARSAGAHRLVAMATSQLAWIAQQEGHIEEALRRRRAAILACSRLGGRRLVARETGFLGVLLFNQGDPDAERTLLEAVEVSAAAGVSGVEIASRCALAVEAAEAGRAEVAAERLAGASARSTGPQDVAIVRATEGLVLLLAGRASEAERAFAEAEEGFVATGRAAQRVIFGAYRAALLGPEEGKPMLAVARAAWPKLSHEQRLVCEVVEVHLEGGESSQRLLDEVEAHPSASLRVLLRVLAGRSAPTVRLDGTTFRVQGERVDLTRRRKLVRVLACIAAHHPEAVGRDALIAAVWPDERLVGDSGSKRLHVAMYTLRKAGLGDLLRTWEVGEDIAYGLAPSVRVEAV